MLKRAASSLTVFLSILTITTPSYGANNQNITVISNLSVQANQIDSFDQGFIGTTPIFGTPITFSRVPESSLVVGLVSLGIMGVGWKIRK